MVSTALKVTETPKMLHLRETKEVKVRGKKEQNGKSRD